MSQATCCVWSVLLPCFEIPPPRCRLNAADGLFCGFCCRPNWLYRRPWINFHWIALTTRSFSFLISIHALNLKDPMRPHSGPHPWNVVKISLSTLAFHPHIHLPINIARTPFHSFMTCNHSDISDWTSFLMCELPHLD